MQSPNNTHTHTYFLSTCPTPTLSSSPNLIPSISTSSILHIPLSSLPSPPPTSHRFQPDVFAQIHIHISSSPLGHKHSTHTLTPSHCHVHGGLERNDLPTSHSLISSKHHRACSYIMMHNMYITMVRPRERWGEGTVIKLIYHPKFFR